jgi:hypothetical protein
VARCHLLPAIPDNPLDRGLGNRGNKKSGTSRIAYMIALNQYPVNTSPHSKTDVKRYENGLKYSYFA